jgi:hypothetical protein
MKGIRLRPDNNFNKKETVKSQEKTGIMVDWLNREAVKGSADYADYKNKLGETIHESFFANLRR